MICQLLKTIIYEFVVLDQYKAYLVDGSLCRCLAEPSMKVTLFTCGSKFIVFYGDRVVAVVHRTSICMNMESPGLEADVI